MKICCPGCTATKEIFHTSRFATFQCCGCHTKFKGFEAKVPSVPYTLGLFNPFSTVRLWSKNKTSCPYCWNELCLNETDSGFYAPSVCYNCGRDLDNNHAQESDEVDFVV